MINTKKLKISVYPIVGIMFIVLGFALPIFEVRITPTNSFFFYILVHSMVSFHVLIFPIAGMIYGSIIVIINIVRSLSDATELEKINRKWFRASLIILVSYGLYLFLAWLIFIVSWGNTFIPIFPILCPFFAVGFVLIGFFLNRKRIETEKEESKPKMHENPEWLRHQYHTLKRSLQDIANEVGVSMIEIKNRVEQLE